MAKKWKLTDVFNYNRYERFFEVGELVKIIITDLEGNNGEGFWIKIIGAIGAQPVHTHFITKKVLAGATSNINFKGKIDNNLLESYYPKYEEIIEFNLGNIVKTWD